MRSFLTLAIATAALVLADPAPAKAQVIVGGNPALPFALPFTPFAPFSPLPGAWLPGGTGVIPYANGGPVEFGLNRALWTMASRGYGPYASYYSPVPAPRLLGTPLPAPPAKWVDPWAGNPGLHKGWFKGGGKGGGNGKGKGKGKG